MIFDQLPSRTSILKTLCLFVCVFFGLQAQEECREASILTFDEAVYRAFSSSPRLRISSAEICGREGERNQSSRYSNPEFSYSVEDVLGNKNWYGWRSAEERYALSQLIEVGGQRQYRTNVASFQYYAAQARYERTRMQLLNDLLKSFVKVVAIQEQLKLALEKKNIEEEVFKTISAKVKEGKVSQIQQNKAEIAFVNTDIALQKARSNLEVAKERLSLIWASPYPDFDLVSYPLYDIDPPEPLEHYLSTLRNNPELLQSQYEYLASHQYLKLQKAERIPRVVVSVGYKSERETHRKGAIFGVAMPIPVFNQNQGNIQRAQAESSKALDQRIEVQLFLESRLSILYKEVIIAYQEAERIKSTVLKSATQSFEFASDGYKEGKFEYLDMLDSKRTLFDIQESYIESLLNYHQRRADIEYLKTEAN